MAKTSRVMFWAGVGSLLAAVATVATWPAVSLLLMMGGLSLLLSLALVR